MTWFISFVVVAFTVAVVVLIAIDSPDRQETGFDGFSRGAAAILPNLQLPPTGQGATTIAAAGGAQGLDDF